MAHFDSNKTLPLRSRTPDRWAKMVLKDTRALLSDHAYLERKAASNALELLNRWREPQHPDSWVPTLSSIARDEAAHLNAVTRHLKKRGGHLERKHKSSYAGDLRKLVRMGQGPLEIMDRLLVSALIEARSCERFDILARHCQDRELADFYKSLWSSEFSHYKTFIKLAETIRSAREVKQRWEELLKKEGKIILRQPSGPGIHSGVKGSAPGTPEHHWWGS